MIGVINEWDLSLFVWINTGWSHAILDVILPLFREKLFWAPMYIFLLSFIGFNFPRRKGLVAILMIALTLGIADTLSSKVVKPMMKRERPCNDAYVQQFVELRVRCGGGYSFTSSHATNHFALATLLFFIFSGVFRWRWLFFVWAGSVGIAQIYVGVHYPLDILAGSILGLSIGLATSWGFWTFGEILEDRVPIEQA